MPPLPPLALYVHLPWCLRKCPYCDFNSHPVEGAPPVSDYIEALLRDLEEEVAVVGPRRIHAVFIGGGTPSLFRGAEVAALLEGIDRRAPLAAEVEITLEANPGTADAARFHDYRSAGVNRLSLGIQSFDDEALARLGRIHDARQAHAAFESARRAGFENINLDLMYGLPGQRPEDAVADLRRALALGPEHLSWYQLTLEPGTPFHRRPPPLPCDDTLWAIQRAGLERLEAAGYLRYEISAFALEGRRCRHNLNYWTFGDYLGIGAGAHGKLTNARGVFRYQKPRRPRSYMAAPRREAEQAVAQAELPLEFLMNALRLVEGVDEALFTARTGLPPAALEPGLSRLRRRGLLAPKGIRATPRGLDFLNELLLEFHP